jgi:hypothetical protein
VWGLVYVLGFPESSSGLWREGAAGIEVYSIFADEKVIARPFLAMLHLIRSMRSSTTRRREHLLYEACRVASLVGSHLLIRRLGSLIGSSSEKHAVCRSRALLLGLFVLCAFSKDS